MENERGSKNFFHKIISMAPTFFRLLTAETKTRVTYFEQK